MSAIVTSPAASRSFFVTGADRQARLGVLAGPYQSPLEAGTRISETRAAAERQGLMARYRVLGVAEGPTDLPTFLGRI